MKSSPKAEIGYFDLRAAAQYCGLSIRSLRRLIAMPGGLSHYRIGQGKILIRRQDLDNFLEQNRHEPMDLDALASEIIREMRG